MSLYESIQISSQGVAVQRQRMQLVASNLANVSTTEAGDGDPYRRRQLIVQAQDKSAFASTFDQMTGKIGEPNANDTSDEMIKGVRATSIELDPSPFIQKYEPGHPHADERGYVAYPNVNPAVEMVDLVGIQRSFEANNTVIKSAKNMIRSTIDLLR